LWSDAVRPASPAGSLELVGGRILADTGSTSGAFSPLRLTVGSGGKTIVNDGQAWYSIDPVAVTVSDGSVRVDGSEYQATGADLTCGDGVPVAPPAGTPSETPTVLPEPSPNTSPSVSPSPSPTPSLSPTPPAPQTPGPRNAPTTGAPVVPPPATTRAPSPSRPPSRTPSSPTPGPTTESPTPPANQPPTVSWERSPDGQTISQDTGEGGCSQEPTTVPFLVSVKDDSDGPFSVTVSWSGFASGSGSVDGFAGSIGPVPRQGDGSVGGTLTVIVTAEDSGGLKGEATATVNVAPCQPIIS
jgi:putative peptide zinc metalloprotease protein